MDLELLAPILKGLSVESGNGAETGVAGKGGGEKQKLDRELWAKYEWSERGNVGGGRRGETHPYGAHVFRMDRTDLRSGK